MAFKPRISTSEERTRRVSDEGIHYTIPIRFGGVDSIVADATIRFGQRDIPALKGRG